LSSQTPKVRPWHNEKMTREAEAIGIDILRLLERRSEPMAPIAIREAIRPDAKLVGKTDGMVLHMLRLLYRLGNIKSSSRVNRLTLALDRPRFAITDEGLNVLRLYRGKRSANFN